ncbi:ROK family transcriptional regulator [Variovorax sp. YR750]|uniref:ROK family transcriptional regulator n=1 Tax=Variovorax sp. YR750 TaxID=1884384 RepID=UPI000B88EA83|nr:ROK family transcriptional regulator [Variovorax sp. YR750]
MRFAPPKQLRIADRTDGLNPERVRSYNERVVLSLLLQNEGISRLEIGARTKLSAQTVSVIVRSLEHEGLLSHGEALRGRVGPPTIPVLLNPDGAFSVGIDLGDLDTQVVLIDFLGVVRFQAKVSHADLSKDALREAIHDAVGSALEVLTPAARTRVAGIGLALPEDGRALSAPHVPTVEELSLQGELEQAFKLPVFVQNDITCAAGAEMMFGATKTISDHLFFFIGEMLHSRLVLNNHVYTGNYSISPASFDAGLLSLQRKVARVDGSSFDPERGDDWRDLGDSLDRWRSECVGILKQSTRSLAQFVDIRSIIVSAAMPNSVSEAICGDLQRAIPGVRVTGGAVKIAPKAVGAGSLPFIARLTVQH